MDIKSGVMHQKVRSGKRKAGLEQAGFFRLLNISLPATATVATTDNSLVPVCDAINANDC
jgi:hypothetical protein